MKLTADGTVKLDVKGHVSILYVSGSLGAGTATLGYLPTEGFTSFKTDTGGAETLVPGEQYEIRHGMNMPVYVQLTGSTGASLSIMNQSVS